ncbi:hypothetical protein [Mycobacterium sp.]|uniref:hypothetical protein n=1 Tax=Mycobacterium sp. TaxID=1785 RepID=UPI0026042596|nr:hypothetical protein [Mycobacterium sp.]
MPEVAGGEGAELQANAVAAQTADKGISFVDGESGDAADAILDEVLAGETPAETPAEGGAEPGAEPAAPAAAAKPPEPKPDTPAAPIEDARLRKGFAKLAEGQQKLVEQQNALRQERAAVAGYADKAKAYDALLERMKADPAGVIAELGDEAVNKTLQGFIDREKSPAERETAKLRADIERDKAERLRLEQERVAADWRNGITAKVQADERFDLVNSLGLHGAVIDVITGYYEKHSERDDNGNVTVPAILDWAIAAQAVEDHRASLIEKSKRYGKRTPAAETPVTGKPKEAPSAKTTPAAQAKKPPTSLSSVPVAEGPSQEEEFPTDDLDERQRRVLASLGLS